MKIQTLKVSLEMGHWTVPNLANAQSTPVNRVTQPGRSVSESNEGKADSDKA